MAGLARNVRDRILSVDGRNESSQDVPSLGDPQSSTSMDISGSLTGYTPRRSSFEPRTDFYRSVSLPVRHTAAVSPSPADEQVNAAQAQPIKKPHGFSLSPMLSRRRPAATASTQQAEPEDVTPSVAPDDGVAHSAPITIERQPRSASRDLAVAYDDLAMTPSDASRTATSSLGSGVMPNSSDHDEEFSRRYREWHDVVYASNF